MVRTHTPTDYERIKREYEKIMKELSISATVEGVASSIENSLPTVRRRLKAFVGAFNREFHSPYERASAGALAWALMGAPITLYALRMNGPVIVELHGILERFAMRDVTQHLVKPRREDALRNLIERRGLPDLALAYSDLGIWNESDVKFATKLHRIRNGVAHKNPKVISREVCSGKRIHILDIDSTMTNVNVVPLILRTIRLLMKLSTHE